MQHQVVISGICSCEERHFLFIKKNMAKVGKQSNISINVFDYEDETPYPFYTSEEIFEKHLDLMLLSKILLSN